MHEIAAANLISSFYAPDGIPKGTPNDIEALKTVIPSLPATMDAEAQVLHALVEMFGNKNPKEAGKHIAEAVQLLLKRPTTLVTMSRNVALHIFLASAFEAMGKHEYGYAQQTVDTAITFMRLLADEANGLLGDADKKKDRVYWTRPHRPLATC